MVHLNQSTTWMMFEGNDQVYPFGSFHWPHKYKIQKSA